MFSCQSFDRHECTLHIRIEGALLYKEIVIEYRLELHKMDAQYRYIEDFRHDRLSDTDDDRAIQRTSRRISIIVIYVLNQSKGIRE